jgi:hypothetical protein
VRVKVAAAERLGRAFQQFSKRDWHRLRGRVSYVPTLHVTDQIALKVVQIGAKDSGNLRPFSIVAKHLSASNHGDNVAGLRIADEVLPYNLWFKADLDVHDAMPRPVRQLAIRPSRRRRCSALSRRKAL